MNHWRKIVAIVILLAALVAGAGPTGAQSGAPTVVSYQGQVTVSGTPYTGTGYFKFAIIDQAGTTTYWSNDGTSIGGGEPSKPVQLAVTNGLFNVLLGDTTLANMIPLPASAFDGTGRALRVWFGTDSIPSVLLSPDRRIAAEPYALQAEQAASASDADMLDGLHAGDLIHAGQSDSVTSGMIVNGTIALGDIGQNGCAADQVLRWNGIAWACATMTIVTDHGALAGLADDDHPQYFNLGQAEIVNGVPAFNGGTSGVSAPFSVDSTYLVTSLNADLLDGQHAAYFAASTHNHDSAYVNEGQANSVTSAMIVAGTVDSTDLADGATLAEILDDDGSASGLDADLLDGVQGSGYQMRVSGGCTVGRMIRAVNADGSVVCEPDAPLRRAVPPQANASTAVDATGDVGYNTSITIGADGLPVVSYRDHANGYLKVAHCGTADCTAGNTSATVDVTGSPGHYTSIAIGADGLPVISYYDDVNDDLKVVHCGDAACTTDNTIVPVDSTGIVGWFASIAIGADGLPVISYYDASNDDLRVAHCGTASCAAGNTITPVDTAGTVGQDTSIAIGADGLPVVSYFDITNGHLKVAHCGTVDCTAGNTTTTVDLSAGVGQHTSIAIGADGLPVISYYDSPNGNLKVLHCGSVDCTLGNTGMTVDSAGYVGEYTSISIGADGLPVVSYSDLTNAHLKLLHCGTAACAAGNTTVTVDALGEYTAITIGADGLPIVSYCEAFSDDLKVMHCSNVFCVPYWRRR